MASSIEGSEAVDKCAAMTTSRSPSPLTVAEKTILRRALADLAGKVSDADLAFIEGAVGTIPRKVRKVWAARVHARRDGGALLFVVQAAGGGGRRLKSDDASTVLGEAAPTSAGMLFS